MNDIMRPRFTISLISLVLCSCCLSAAVTPERISRLLSQIPCSVTASGTFRCDQLDGRLSFYALTEDDAVVQVGAHLFADEVKNEQNTMLLERVERLWLELLLRRTVESQSALLKEYGIRMVLNGYLFARGNFNSLDDALTVLRHSSSVTVAAGGPELDLAVSDGSGNTLHFYVPADRDLLSPWDKKEAEDRLRAELAAADDRYAPSEFEAPNAAASGMIVAGGECYMIDSLRNDIFLLANGTSAVPVFGSEYPVESFRNMLMSVLTPGQMSDWYATLRFRSYSRNPETVQIPVGTLLMHLRRQGLKSYTALYESSAGHHKILMVLYHPVYQYLHMILFDFPSDILKTGGRKHVDAEMSMYIPQHNIKALFNDRK